jgi:hypothetical protein
MHVDIGELDRACRLLEQRAAAVMEESGRNGVAHVHALAEWAELLVASQQPLRAREVLERASESARAMIAPDAMATLSIDLAYGELYRYSRDARGLEHAERALKHAMQPGVDPLLLVQALLQLGVQQSLAGRPDQAKATLQRAIDGAKAYPEGESRLPTNPAAPVTR